jgi:UDPglucose--hexose-1-phosphate uridylyltransferase
VFEKPHRRLNPLTGEHVLVSPQRTQRPWQGKVERIQEAARPEHDPKCYLCSGNERAGGKRNPQYTGTFAFDNDFAALLPLENSEQIQDDHLFCAVPEYGICRVLCFSPRHDLSLPELSSEEIEEVISVWTDETRTLSKNPNITNIQIFENKGELMGCSNPHPHSQIWATQRLPNEPAKELIQQKAYFNKHSRPMLEDVVQRELEANRRIVIVNEHWAALVPFWAAWPFETIVLPRFRASSLLDLNLLQRKSLADILKRLTTRYDNLFEVSFPYSMGFHQAPFDSEDHTEWTLHMHFYPPLLRSAVIRKFMVGFEMLGMPGRDITPESAAERLRELSEIHYKKA